MTSQSPLPVRLTVKAAAPYLGLSTSTLNKWRVTGLGPAYLKLGPRRVVYDRADLDAWLAASRRRSTSDC